MSDNSRLEIEELLNNYLNAISQGGDHKKFFKSKVTDDFIAVWPDSESSNATQLMMSNSYMSDGETLKSGKIDLINKIEISNDEQLAFFAFTSTLLFEKKLLFGVTDDIYNLSIFSGYLKKIQGEWKLAWAQQATKYTDSDE